MQGAVPLCSCLPLRVGQPEQPTLRLSSSPRRHPRHSPRGCSVGMECSRSVLPDAVAASQPCVVTDHLERGQCDQGTEFLAVFH